jgi:hypothetical protein
MKKYLLAAIMCAAVVVQPAFAGPAENPAVEKARQIRMDIEAKQKELAEEKHAEAPAPAAPTMLLELPVDETDAPGATQK